MDKTDNDNIGTASHVPHILVVCNRPDTAVVWGHLLREKGLTALLESSTQKAMERWSAEPSDLVVIDVDAAQEELLEICRGFRGVSVAPILLFLPTHHETLILDAYAAGMDDVVVKPLSPAVFQAKILAWARRSWMVPMERLNLVHAGRHRLDPSKRCLVNPHGGEIKLTNLEFRLLHLLMSQPGQICDTDELIQSIWGTYGGGDHVLLKNVVYRLRKKIEAHPGNPELIITWPHGYSFQG
jgi:DNA-binding response OmpR family regulator